MSNIPNIIHYCWFGDKMPFILRQCVRTFSKIKADKIICWNEQNSPLDANQNIKTLPENKEWAFVSDYVRLKALYDYGGIYFDTDIEVKYAFPKEFYDADLVIGYAYDNVICTAMIMAKKHHPLIKHWLELTHNIKPGEKVVNNGSIYKAIKDLYPDFVLDGKFQEFAPNCFIYPRYYFDSATYRSKTGGGFCVHHGMGSWHSPRSVIKRMLRPTVKLLRYYVKPFCVWYMNKVNKRIVAQCKSNIE